MPKPVNNRAKLLGFPRSYAFVVGINNYPKIKANLKSAVNDARALAIALKHHQGFDHVELLLDPHPEEDREELQKDLDGIQLKWSADGATFREMLKRIQDPSQSPFIHPEDCIVFYYAGHEDSVILAVFSPDSTQILTAAGDFTAKLWPTPPRIYDYLKNETIISQLNAEQRKLHRVY